MDGIETTRAIRASEKRTDRHVPIIALTAHALASDRERCLQAGMDGYLSKPIQPAVLLEAIDKLHTAASLAPSPKALDVLDRGALLNRVDGDAQLLGEVAALFMTESGKLMSAIRDAIAAGDAEGFSRSVHTMRGMLRSLSADAADGLAQTLQSLDPLADRQGAEAAWGRLEEAVAGFKAGLRSLADEAESSVPEWSVKTVTQANGAAHGYT